MAEITIERKPRSRAVPWILGILLLLAVALGVWWFVLTPDGAENAPPVAGPPPAGAPPGSGY